MSISESEVLLSIVIPTYNSACTIKKVLNSIINLTYPNLKCIELIIIDDNSSDETLRIINEFTNKYQDKLYSIKTIVRKGREGVVSARNLGARLAQGKYILFLDSDVLLKPNILRRLIEVADRDPHTVVSIPYVSESPSILELIGVCRYLGKIRCGTVFGGAVLVRREVVDHNLLFDERLGYPYSALEDFEYGVRLKKHRYKVLVYGKELLVHIKCSRSKSNKNGKILKVIVRKIREYFSRKHRKVMYIIFIRAPLKFKLEYMLYMLFPILVITLMLWSILYSTCLLAIGLLISIFWSCIECKSAPIMVRFMAGPVILLSRVARALSLMIKFLEKLLGLEH